MSTSRGVAWVVGASSGIGRAVAVELGAMGYAVAVSARRAEELASTVQEITDAGGTAAAVPLDVTVTGAVAAAAAQVEDRLGTVEVLVHSAGSNVPNRWWTDLTVEDFERLAALNLTSVTAATLAVLPGMRRRSSGTIVVVSSWAGFRFMTGSGVSYGATKAALSPLVESLNDQEGRRGIRATHLCPGEVRTPILCTKPVPPSEEEMARMLAPEDVARAVRYVVEQPPGVCVNELVVSPLRNRMYHDYSAYPG